jgi:hypothetical protein
LVLVSGLSAGDYSVRLTARGTDHNGTTQTTVTATYDLTFSVGKKELTLPSVYAQ